MKERAVGNELNEFLAERRLEDAIWSRMAAAALRVGCPIEQAEAYCEMALEACKPIDLQEDPRGWDNKPLPKVVGPKPEKETLHAEYRTALADLLGMLDDKTLEESFADIAKDAAEFEKQIAEIDKRLHAKR